MKKLLALILSAAMLLGLCGCGNTTEQAPSTQQTETTAFVATEPAPTETQPPAENLPTTIKSVKILAIGNSFSVDAMQHLYTVLKAEGVEEIVMGNLYIGGCPLDKHAANAKSGEQVYKYYRNVYGEWETHPFMVSLLEGLQDQQWDIITMQQGSAKSGIADEYQPHLDDLIAFVNENKTNPDAKLYWHMTWAYQGDSTHSAFPNYGNSQSAMYLGIVNALQQAVEPTEAFTGLLPVGTAIQNARTGFVGDTLTRDGFHLSDLGRIIASYTWYAVLDGQPLYAVNVDKVGTQKLTDSHKRLIVEAVNNAISNPYAVTESTVKTS